MKTVGISGTWRTTSHKVEHDVRATVRQIFAEGNAIVTGGATGVDFFATDEALKIDPVASRITVAIPSTFESYIDHLRAWTLGHNTGDPSVAQVETDALIGQLNCLRLARAGAIVEGAPVPALDIAQRHYDQRNSVVASLADEVIAFQVNKSAGTQDTIDKARAAGKKVTVFSYTEGRDKTYGTLRPRI